MSRRAPFRRPNPAGVVATRLNSLGAKVFRATKDGQPIYRVRIGPFQDVEQADAMLLRVQALGHNDVQIVVELRRAEFVLIGSIFRKPNRRIVAPTD